MYSWYILLTPSVPASGSLLQVIQMPTVVMLKHASLIPKLFSANDGKLGGSLGTRLA